MIPLYMPFFDNESAQSSLFESNVSSQVCATGVDLDHRLRNEQQLVM